MGQVVCWGGGAACVFGGRVAHVASGVRPGAAASMLLTLAPAPPLLQVVPVLRAGLGAAASMPHSPIP